MQNTNFKKWKSLDVSFLYVTCLATTNEDIAYKYASSKSLCLFQSANSDLVKELGSVL